MTSLPLSGLCPQTSSSLGGYRVQGKSLEKAKELFDDAKALERAGVTALVLEMIPSELAEFVTQNVSVPTIGIGAGGKTNGQVLVWHGECWGGRELGRLMLIHL